MGRSLVFTIPGDVGTIIRVEEITDPLTGIVSLRFDVTLDESGAQADLRGLFFDVADSALLGGLSVSGADVTTSRFARDAVTDLGNGANMNGALTKKGNGFDAGIAFGTPGIGKDDIDQTGFTLSSSAGDLSLELIAQMRFGVRLTSVGPEGCREDSLKLAGMAGGIVDAQDDAGALCATETVTLDVLANDIGAAGVVRVAGVALATGDSVTLDSGAVVTLTQDGTLRYDSATGTYDVDGASVAAGDLLLGSTAVDSFLYEISNGAGGFDTARVDVTLHGALNTLDTIEASLPQGGLFKVTLDTAGSAFYDLTITGTGDARLDGLTIDAAYCAAAHEPFDIGQTIAFEMYLADADSIPAGTVQRPEHLDEVNWILNQDFTTMSNGSGGTFTQAEIQGAIWGLLDDFVFVNEAYPAFGKTANARKIYDMALAQGDGFEAGADDLVGLILQPTAAAESDGNHQPFVVGLAFEMLEQDCLIL
ncbi:hypothetical protein T8T21_19090 (plasmid) [Limimaricola variabilis]|uniref:hypothetical protein n=1 Tax=Limimaricola variabilis TaxID=1492771 RepID=UPI002AC99918|nr:hypothetical protein [Limimaricola variabilis]WPY96651.1 hypothetical protein T8T21_19090 [Limimaricola variabilis]